MAEKIVKGHFKDIRITEDVKEVKASYEPTEFKLDPKGYFLIRVNYEEQIIQLIE